MAEEASFDDLVEAIQDAFIKVNNMSETQHLQKLADYFGADHFAKSFQIKYPYYTESGEMDYKDLDVPQICLLPMSSLKLDEVEVEFKVQLQGEVKLKGDENKRAFQMGALGSSAGMEGIVPETVKEKRFVGYIPQGMGRRNKDENFANIRLKFTSGDPPEGLMRIQDQFIKVTL